MQKPTSILSPSLYTKRHRGMKITIFTNLFSRKILTASTQGNATKFASSKTSKGKKQLEQSTSVKDFFKAVAKGNYKHTIPDSLYETHRGMKMTIFTNLFSRKILTASTERKRHKIRIIQNQQGKKQLEQSNSVKEDFFKAVARRKFMLLTKSLKG